MEHAFEIMIGVARALIAFLGYGATTLAVSLAVFGVIVESRRGRMTKGAPLAMVLLLMLAFVLNPMLL